MANRTVVMIAALALLEITAVAPAVAQFSERAVPGPATFSDAELKSFAKAAVKVERIADSYEPRLKAAQTVKEQKIVEEAASDEMTRAATQEGLTVDRYKEILKHSLTDPEVGKRVKRHIREAR